MLINNSSRARRALCIFLLAVASAQAQGGKDFLQWLKEYSPTGYFVINEYETKEPAAGWHKQWIEGQTLPLGAVAVHETGHMRNLNLLAKGNVKSYYVDNLKDYAITFNFTPFLTTEMKGDIPASLHNFITEVYIEAGPGNYSVGSGMIGLMEEWNQYITGLKSAAEMMACFKANFNTPQNIGKLAGDVTTSVWANAEFRYFCLRYIMRAKISHADVYTKITTHTPTRELYTLLVQFAEKTMEQWIALLKAENINTTTQYGFDWHWKYWNEIQKPEYKDLEKIMLVSTVGVAPYFPARRPDLRPAGATVGLFDLQGRMIPARGLGGGVYVMRQDAAGHLIRP